MPIACHVQRRGAVYYYRRRRPRHLGSLDTCQSHPHVFISLLTSDPRRARSLGVQLDAIFEDIVMLAGANFLSPHQVDGLLRAVIAKHSRKLDLLANAAMQFPGFDPDQAVRDDLLAAWTYRLLDMQGANAVVRPKDREAMNQAGLTDDDVDAVVRHVDMLRGNGLVPTKHHILQKLVAEQGGELNAMNLATAQRMYFRGLSLAAFAAAERYGGEVADAAEIVSAARRIDRSSITVAPPVASPTPAVPVQAVPVEVVAASPLAGVLPPPPTAAPGVACSFEEHPVWLAAQRLLKKHEEHGPWNANGIKQARGNYRLLVLLLLKLKVYRIEDLQQQHCSAYANLLGELATSYGKSAKDSTRTLEELLAEGKKKPEHLRGLEAGTINKHLSKLEALLRFMRAEGAKFEAIEFRGLRITKTTRDRDLTQSATPRAQNLLFGLAVFLGCAGPEQPFEPGNDIFHCANYFVPQLLKYKGARREEMCSLMVEEVNFDGSVPFIDIRENPYRDLKTLSSPRALPIHSEPLRLLFREYYEAIKALGYDLLFPELRWGDATMPLGDRFAKNFQSGMEIIRATEAELEAKAAEERRKRGGKPPRHPNQAFSFSATPQSVQRKYERGGSSGGGAS